MKELQTLTNLKALKLEAALETNFTCLNNLTKLQRLTIGKFLVKEVNFPSHLRLQKLYLTQIKISAKDLEKLFYNVGPYLVELSIHLTNIMEPTSIKVSFKCLEKFTIGEVNFHERIFGSLIKGLKQSAKTLRVLDIDSSKELKAEDLVNFTRLEKLDLQLHELPDV
jgi:hypothetical protein